MNNWRAVWLSIKHVELYNGDVLIANIVRTTSFKTGEAREGWRVVPNQSSRRTSLKLWTSAADAVRSKHGYEAARAVDAAYTQFGGRS